MQKIDLFEDLRRNPYPGRGILLGRHADGVHAVMAYFIMGRSENSRNRVFVLEGENMKTRAFDEAKMVDPSLIIYYPVRVLGNQTIVTNGDQTDTIFDALSAGGTFEGALRTRTFEPDPDNYTPRISGLMTVADGACEYRLSILKSDYNNPASAQRFFFEYSTPLQGEGHLIHTYETDGNPIPSYWGEPKTVSVDGSIDSFTDALWNSLNEANKVSLFVRFVDCETGKTETKIVNKHQ